ncbi:MAG: hypothetical protein A2015_15615 [Spirochaetes bacterium GWF1_31_7]|nr:MAG: hypothetical protein A2Y30_01630 [Spirochaetes bacterium GWE1_32_154]OHD47050.1 MAG: hypothetical protein A2Y29_06525 [Spirochaetes bacterium GWE2_31_10]OHD53056.1 MAG: hypothetical protein A2015_15615 [Spirochaetes bacterium GWF1_31_7]HBD94825.1 hypothetical protein [Spirochaetia bacterium]
MKIVFKNKKVVGAYLITLGILGLLNIFFNLSILYAVSILTIFLSIHLLLKAFSNKIKNGKLFITGSILFLINVFIIVYDLLIKNTGYTLTHLWPVIPMLIGLTFILYKIFINKESIGIYIPGLFIFFISIVLMLYTFNILSDFKKFLLLLIPCFIIYLGIYLVTDTKRG